MYKAPSRLFAILSLSATAFASGVGSALLSGDLGNLGLFAEENLEIWERATIFADAIGAETLVSLRSHDQITSDIWAPGRISLLDHSHQIWGDIHYGALEEIAPGFNTQNGYRFPMQSGEWLPRALKAEPVRYGTADIWEGSGQRVDLAPGDYRDVEVRYPSSIRLSAGTYNFRKLKLTDYVAVTYDVTNGPIYVNVEEELELRQTVRNEFVPSVQPFSLRWRTNQTADVIFAGFDNIHYGVVTAPNAKVTIGQRVNFVGAIRAKSISVQPAGAVCVPPVLEDLRHSEVAMGPWFDSWTAEYVATVRTGVDTLHFEAKAPSGATVTFSDNDFAPSGTRTVVVTLTDPARSMELPGCAESRYRVRVVESGRPQVFVKASSPCSGASCNGRTWETALHSLQAGLDSAQASGREVWLAEGTYAPEREYVPGDATTKSFYLGSGAEIRGGFAGTETSLDARSGLLYREVVLRGDSVARTVVVAGGAPTIDGVVVENGGVLVAGGDPTFSQSTLRNGIGAFGGNLQIASGASAKIDGGFVHGGYAVLDGGAVHVADGAAFEAVNSVFFGNAVGNGTSLFGGNGDVSLDFVTAENGGATCIAAKTLKIANSAVWGGEQCAVESNTAPVVERSDVKGLPAGAGNVGLDPMFANAADPVGEDGILGSLDDGLIPQSGSPLIDGGEVIPDSVTFYDILGIRRGFDGDNDGIRKADIGAHEYYRQTERTSLLGHLVNGKYEPDDRAAFIMFADCVERQKRLFSHSDAGYVIQLRHAPNKHLKESFYGNLVALDTNMKVIKDAPEMKVTFYFAGSDDATGEMLYQSRTATAGARFVMTGSRDCHEQNEHGMFMYAPYGNFRVTVPYKQFK